MVHHIRLERFYYYFIFIWIDFHLHKRHDLMIFIYIYLERFSQCTMQSVHKLKSKSVVRLRESQHSACRRTG